MLFHIAQKHNPELCPIDHGGPQTLYNSQASGATLKNVYFSFSEHTTFLIVEAESIEAVHRLLRPGFRRCQCHITPVSENPTFE